VLHGAGFASLGRSAEFYGLGLALGNGDVTLLELANGYRALANGGVWRPYQWRSSAPGEAVEPGVRITSQRSAALALDILADPVARIPAFGLATPLDFPFPVAAKTGTSRHFTDNWAVAATGRFTVAVWVGNFSGRPMEGVSGVSGAGPLLHRSVLAAARRYDPGVLPTPGANGAVPVAICRLSGLAATARCPTAIEWFPPGHAPLEPCDWHRDSGVVLPAEYAEWSERISAEGNGRAAPSRHPGTDRSKALTLVSPVDGDVYRVPPGADPKFATVALRAAGGGGEQDVRWYVDGRQYHRGRWGLEKGVHRFRAVTRSGESAEAIVTVE
jgi:penicillin-binding protein 1C